jgi:hypothetical protein
MREAVTPIKQREREISIESLFVAVGPLNPLPESSTAERKRERERRHGGREKERE